MKSLFILMLIVTNSSQAANYYFSSLIGNDSRTSTQAQNPATPWKTINKLNLFMSNLKAGDSILFNRGEIFRGSIAVTKSGILNSPIVFSAYGIGARPIISGLTAITNWTNSGNGIWESLCSSCGSSVNLLIINGKEQAMGRYPNRSASNGGYLTLESHAGTTQITDNQLAASPDWTGGEVVIRKNHWIIDRNPITQHSGNIIRYISASTYQPIDNFGYFIQNHKATLDQEGEWYYNSSLKHIEIYYAQSNPSSFSIEASIIDTLIKCVNQSYIVFDNLCFKGANKKSFFTGGAARNISVQNSDITLSGYDGMDLIGHNSKVENCTLSSINNNAIIISGNYCSVNNNIIKNIGLIPGMGQSRDNNYNGVQLWGDNNLCEANNFDSIGFMPIAFQGDSVLIKNNFINYFTLIKDDGGGIYTYTGSGNISKKGRVIKENIILNGLGASEGTDSKDVYSEGIYIDDNSGNVQVIGNTVAYCSHNGIYLHNSNSTSTTKNTLFDNNSQLLMRHEDNTCVGCLMQNNKLYDNIFFSKKPTQLVSSLESFKNDIKDLGVLDSNYYCRPLADDYVIYTNNSFTASVYNLQEWQSTFPYDAASKKSPFPIPYYTFNGPIGTNKFSNGNFNSSINGLYCWSPAGNCNTTWDNSGKLDGGSLRFLFSSNSGIQNLSTFVIAIGAISSSKNYILKFSLLGTKKNKTMSVYLRQSQAPYRKLTPVNYFKTNDSRSENEFLFSFPITENDASIGFEIEEQDSTIWIDNIQLLEANVNITIPEDYIRFEYNATKASKTFSLAETMYDVKNKSYTGTFSLAPFASIILMKRPIITSIATLEKKERVVLFPNPSSNILNISVRDNKVQKIGTEIYDVMGRLISMEETIINSDGEFQLDISAFKAGIYLLKIMTNLNSYQETFIKSPCGY